LTTSFIHLEMSYVHFHLHIFFYIFSILRYQFFSFLEFWFQEFKDCTQCLWYMPVILATTQGQRSGGSWFEASPRKIVCDTISWKKKKTHHKTKVLVEWLKSECLPSKCEVKPQLLPPTKKKKKDFKEWDPWTTKREHKEMKFI
jgi:hypothetical protein